MLLNAQVLLPHFSPTFLYYTSLLCYIKSFYVQKLLSQCQESCWWIAAQNAHTTWWSSWQLLTRSTCFPHHPKLKCPRLFCISLLRPVAGCSLPSLRMSLPHPLQECIWSRKIASVPAKHCEGRRQRESFPLQIPSWYFRYSIAGFLICLYTSLCTSLQGQPWCAHRNMQLYGKSHT